MIYLKLFFSFFQVGLFSFGGGMAAMPLIQEQVVTKYGWLTMGEFTDLIIIAEMTPGPIGVNSATFVGIRIAGLAGAFIATMGCILPSCAIVSLLAWVYARYGDQPVLQKVLTGLRPAIVALIASAGLSILKLALWAGAAPAAASINIIGLVLFLGAFFVLRRFKANPIFVMTACGVLGGVLYSVL